MIKYDLSWLTDRLSKLATLCRTNISIYDSEQHFTLSKVKNVSFFCNSIKTQYLGKCFNTDLKAINNAINKMQAFNYHCHYGFIEIIIPFNIDLEKTFFIFVGPFRDKENEKKMIKHIKEFSTIFKVDENALIKKYNKIPHFYEGRYEAIVSMVTLLIEHAKLNKLIKSSDNFLENTLNDYLLKNMENKITIPNICDALFITQKQLEYNVKKIAKMTPSKYINYFKIKYIIDKIKFSDENLTTIAGSAGFDDYNYFVKVFKKFYNCTPSKYREINHKN